MFSAQFDLVVTVARPVASFAYHPLRCVRLTTRRCAHGALLKRMRRLITFFELSGRVGGVCLRLCQAMAALEDYNASNMSYSTPLRTTVEYA